VRALVGVAVAGAIGALVFDEMVGDRMMTLDTVHIVTYRAAPKDD